MVPSIPYVRKISRKSPIVEIVEVSITVYVPSLSLCITRASPAAWYFVLTSSGSTVPSPPQLPIESIE